jgi:hypothetical protein
LLPLDASEGEAGQDLAAEEIFDTQRTDGHTYNPHLAQEQGLTYTPPTDPPVVPSEDDPEGVEIAAGFGPSMEESQAGRAKDRNRDMEEAIREALRYNSETQNLRDIRVYVTDSIVSLFGTVPLTRDIGLVASIVEELAGVSEVYSYLQVSD